MSFFTYCTTLADVMRQVTQQGDTGALTEKWTKVKTITCRITTTTITERLVQSREGDVSTHTILCEPNEGILSRDQLWVTDGATVRKYLVNTVDPIEFFTTQHHTRVQATLTE